MKWSAVGLLRVSLALLVIVAGGCGKVGFRSPVDGSAVVEPAVDGPAIDALPSDALAPAALGTMDNPARTCAELQVAGMPSAAYWLRATDGAEPPFQVYCEQELNGGGWAMLENSVRRDDGTTTAFWQFGWDDRLKQRGTLATDQNYYDGSLYLLGTQYMDVFVDLQDTTTVAALMTATGIISRTMELRDPKWIGGNLSVYNDQFAAGWSAKDRDEDDQVDKNCAVVYGDVAQHYSACWSYNLGVDADEDATHSLLDGGVGPHVQNEVLTSLGLALQAEGGDYSQVKRIARFTRW
jgi:hypothetical protein